VRARAAAALALALGAGQAHAWEAQSTHAGFAEQAALASRLHKRLVTLGFGGGLYEPLTIPPADAPALVSDLHLLSPANGAVPDTRGRQTAIAWLSAGAQLADVPAAYGANHFFDPSTGKGWSRPSRGLEDLVIGKLALPDHGEPAPDWITDKRNPFNLAAFLDQYAKAATAATPGERSRHMAAALIAAGAMLHVLADMGSPSRVRGDHAAHLESLGGGPEDLGSRFERIAALTFGRLGVPSPSRTVTRTHLREYFTAPTNDGLADETASAFFSPGTLPHPTRVGGDTHPQLARALPALPARLNLMAASREDGTTLRANDGTCLARYKVEHDVLRFSLDDDCMLEQVAKILPEVTAFETGLLDYLLRGELTLALGRDIVVSAKGLGAGTIEVLVEDERGVRSSIGTAQLTGGGPELTHVPMPAAGTHVIAVFRGSDAAGEPIVAIGSLPLPSR
jgi:hypothetical protein